MKRSTKTKQVVVRFDELSYTKIDEYAEIEHRGLGEFVRHAVLVYIDKHDKYKEDFSEQKAQLY